MGLRWILYRLRGAMSGFLVGLLLVVQARAGTKVIRGRSKLLRLRDCINTAQSGGKLILRA